MNKSENPTRSLDITLHKPKGEENMYVRLGYIPQKILDTSADKFQYQ